MEIFQGRSAACFRHLLGDQCGSAGRGGRHGRQRDGFAESLGKTKKNRTELVPNAKKSGRFNGSVLVVWAFFGCLDLTLRLILLWLVGHKEMSTVLLRDFGWGFKCGTGEKGKLVGHAWSHLEWSFPCRPLDSIEWFALAVCSTSCLFAQMTCVIQLFYQWPTPFLIHGADFRVVRTTNQHHSFLPVKEKLGCSPYKYTCSKEV